jgi:formate dehydrogenase beta subunit
MHIKLHINGKAIVTESGKTILQAALENGIYIPHLCYHPDLKPVGTCGICCIEIDGEDDLSTACDTEAREGMHIKSESERVKKSRLEAMDVLLLNHPAECMNCDAYLTCELRSVRQYIGASDVSRSEAVHLSADYSNPLYVHDFIRCIKCGRCVRACNDLRGVGVLQFIDDGDDRRVGIPDGKSLVEAGCRFCGACVEVCPTGAIRDKKELLEGKILPDALLPCMASCPAHIDIPLYTRLVREGKYSESVAVIREKVPFPETLGYICDHPCENGCRRGEINEPVSIKDLKRFAVENDDREIWRQHIWRRDPTGSRVAIVGSGPAGLTAASYLAMFGHQVTVFDSMVQPGGMLRYGIPSYRLPREVLDREIQDIIALGITLRMNTRIDRVEGLIEDEEFDAVLVAAGMAKGKKLPIPGADLDRVLIGLDFLRQVHSGNTVSIGETVAVIGGGNVAFDCARVALRTGAKDAVVICLEPEEAMLADPEEVKLATQEGVRVLPARSFSRILSDDQGRADGIECSEISEFTFSENGSLQCRIIEGSSHVTGADTIIFAIGQYAEIPVLSDLSLTPKGLIQTDSNTLVTNIKGVFAAGDVVSGGGSVINAIASGTAGAVAIDRYLGGDGEIPETYSATFADPEPLLGQKEAFGSEMRTEREYAEANLRVTNFQPVESALNESSAEYESYRCLRCDLRLHMTPVKFWGDYEYPSP